MSITKLIKKAGVLDCISYLSKNAEATKTELIQNSSACRQSVCDAVSDLVAAGYVEVRKEGAFPGRKIHRLTQSGLKLAHTPLCSLTAKRDQL